MAPWTIRYLLVLVLTGTISPAEAELISTMLDVDVNRN